MSSPIEKQSPSARAPTEARLAGIAAARRAVLVDRSASRLVAPWIERSWQRCLQQGLQPHQEAVFAALSAARMRQTLEANAHLVHTAQPVMQHLGRAIADTGYFAILTNSDGVVIGVGGHIDRSDRRADLITRIGTDLSESSVGTTAIGTTLAEQQSVWLHRGEHFFANTAVYSCAGAPLFGPDGQCIGMLDVTGIEVVERPELKHLLTQVAAKIENALVLAQPHQITVRLNWPGNSLGGDGDGLVCLDAEGWVTGANPVARQMVAALNHPPAGTNPLHVSELFGIPHTMLFDAARKETVLEIPLWTGLRLQAMPLRREQETKPALMKHRSSNPDSVPLKDIETALIHQAVEQARGNVAQAAAALGISRATVYRKLGKKQAG